MSNRMRDGQRAVQAVRNKINNKFFKEKISVSMFQTDSDKDTKAMDNLKIGEEFKDRNGTTWTRNEDGQIEKKGSFLGKYTMPFFCPKCGKIMKGKADNKMWNLHSKCINCVAEEETQMRINGTYEEYEQKKIMNNANAWVKDMEQLATEWINDNNKDKQQFIMNSQGELETWDVKGKKNHNLENLKDNITNVEKQLKEKQDEM